MAFHPPTQRPLLTLHTANRYEDLRDRLLSRISAEAAGCSPPRDPFEARRIVVPSMAIRRDLQLAVSRQSGVCWHVEFPFLAQWLWTCFSQWVDVPEISPFAPQALTWRLYQIFGDPGFIAAHPRLQHFLERADPVMRLELSTRTAGLFEQMVTFRPDWLAAWREGRTIRLPAGHHREDEAWQAALWRRLIRELGISRQHPAEAFLSALENGTAARGSLPRQIDLFALPTLPPQTLHLLNALSAHLDIRLYLLNPCAEYWFDLVDKKRLARLNAANRADFHETGNALLTGWGRQTQALFTLLFESDTTVEASADFVDHPDTLLGQIQNAILHLLPRPETPPRDDDRSLEIHVCHSLTRELEALHDRLLALTTALPDLRADQILVAVPDLEAAAPLIDAVFGARGGLPYTITGRAESRQNPVARALLTAMDTLLSRLTASEGFALLREPPVARCFQLDEPALEALADALRAAGLHWGLSGRQGWREALARLLLGYALGPAQSGARPFRGILPATAGIEARGLGQLGRFLDSLEQFQQRLARPLTAPEWRVFWNDLLDGLLLISPEDYDDARTVRETLQSLTTAMAAASENTDSAEAAPLTFPAPVARAALMQALESSPRGGIPGGTLTFAALSSLRGLPYRVMCLIGLNEGDFPGTERPLEFDLLAHDYRPGDRQRRLDERNLFLDGLLSAREYLHLSYTGRSQRDDSPLPPSSVIAELLDELLPVLGQAGVARLQVHHPLQAFSTRYNDPSRDIRLIHFPPATTPAPGSNTRHPLPPFFASPLPAPPETDWKNPRLGDLHAFFRHPARTLLRDRLGLRLVTPEETLDDEEPLRMAPADLRSLARRLLPHLLPATHPSGAASCPEYPDTTRLEALALAGTEIPEGSIGLAQARPLLNHLQQFAGAIRPALSEPCLPALQTTVAGQGIPVTLYLHLHDIRPQGLIRYRFAPLSAGDVIAAWLDHLALCTLAPAGVALQTVHLAQSSSGSLETQVFRPVEHPHALWQPWLAAYWAGLQHPLIFPPGTAWARQLECRDNPDTPVASATRSRWLNAQQGTGEALDIWWQQALRGLREADGEDSLFSGPLAEPFNHWRSTLLEPLVAHLENREKP